MSIAFDSERHTELVAVLRGATEAISEALERLESDVARLSELWSGEAQRAYANAYSGWTASADVLRGVVRVAERALEAAGETLDQAEHDA